jgi:hypothetical protein
VTRAIVSSSTIPEKLCVSQPGQIGDPPQPVAHRVGVDPECLRGASHVQIRVEVRPQRLEERPGTPVSSIDDRVTQAVLDRGL